MAYKFAWILKGDPEEKVHLGNFLGKVENYVFIPLSLKEAKEKLKRIKHFYKGAFLLLAEVELQERDLKELAKTFQFFEAINVKEDTPTRAIKYIRTIVQEALITIPAITEESWNLDEDTTEAEEEEEEEVPVHEFTFGKRK